MGKNCMHIKKYIKSKLYQNIRFRRYYYKMIKKILKRKVIRDCTKDLQEIDNSIREMQEYRQKAGKRLLVSGHIGSSPRTPYLAKVNSTLTKHYEIIELIESDIDYTRLGKIKWTGITDKEAEALKIFIAPSLFLKDTFVAYEKVKIINKYKKLIAEKVYLSEAVENLKQRHFNMDYSFIVYFVAQSYQYLTAVIDTLAPDCVMLWNQFFAFHHIFEGICKERQIKCMYFEFGVLPGTYAIERKGQMGESYPAQEYKRFSELKVTIDEVRRAKDICEYIKNNRINRKVQPKRNLNTLLSHRLEMDKPIIFYAGQNDFESGLCPYTEHTKQFHSPIFKSSDDAVYYLAKLAKKNGWNIIYKMHPLVSKFCLPQKFPKNVIVIDDVDINDLIEISDLTITILSQTGYVALFNEKPVLMLGYTQLRGKGCNYEVFELEKIESEIKIALQYGFTNEQKNKFETHIAQIIKYYVYDDQWFDKKISYGKSIQDCAEFVQQCLDEEIVFNNAVNRDGEKNEHRDD